MTHREYLTEIADAIRSHWHRDGGIVGTNLAAEIRRLYTEKAPIETPYTPPALGTTNADNAYRAVVAAMSYWAAKSSGTEAYAYVDGHGPLKGATEARLRDSGGNAVIDCSTYIGLVLRGLDYLNSPYYNNTATTVDPRTVEVSDGSWAEMYFDKQTTRTLEPITFPAYTHKTTDGHYRVLTASDQAQYYDSLGLLWYAEDDSRTPQAGDICFFYALNDDGSVKYPSRFEGISHVGIMTGPEHYLNATNYPSSGNLIRTAVASRAPYAYARPYYGATATTNSSTLTVNGVDFVPAVWSGVPQGTTTGTNSCTLALDGKTLTVTGAGTGNSHAIISSGCPLYLPAGAYKLSGVVNNTGGNTTTLHKYWGTRVYYANGDGVPGTTWSSNGAKSETRTPVWDIGGGAAFTLSEPAYITINAYLSSNITFSGLTIKPSLYLDA